MYEGAGQVGGRCRSFFDSKLGIEIDNGNHIILSANSNFLEMCNLVGSENTLNFLGSNYNFYDCKSKNTWNVKIGKNRFPFWIFNKNSRIPETRLFDYISIFKLLLCNKKVTVEEVIGKKNNLYKNFWEPLTLGILNTQCNEASAQILKNVVKETFLKGGKYSGIFQPRKSWDKTLISPMLKFLREKKITPKYNSLLQKITIEKKKITQLYFKNHTIKINNDELVIFAIPPNNIAKVFPELLIPQQFNTIVNVHFKINKKHFKDKPKIIGILNSISHWLFLKEDHCSVTLSASNHLTELPKDQLIKKIWYEVSQSLDLDIKCPPYRLIFEKKATYNQSPENNKMVRQLKFSLDNAFLIGDWTEFNFPCSIESSILSAKKISDKIAMES